MPLIGVRDEIAEDQVDARLVHAIAKRDFSCAQRIDNRHNGIRRRRLYGCSGHIGCSTEFGPDSLTTNRLKQAEG